MLTGLPLAAPIVGILRGVRGDFFADIMRVSFAMGLQAIEVTMNTNGAEQMVAAQRPFVPAGKYLGMGTIRNLDEAERAVAAGAMFLVTPNLDQQVIGFARAQGVPVIVGALTPTEVYNAWAGGADMVKVFPCIALGGASYIRELRGPFEQIPLVAVGGVTADTVPAYFAAGAAAIGVSSALFGREALQARDIDRLANNVRNFITRCPGT
jgi:2-dehydro-3-deoxyphosphogluconate aldolase/(4S)-4-hydroxy-2-oxoglutarate aldolase